MFNGFLMLGGTEIVNAARLEAYVAHQLPGFVLRKVFDSSGIPLALGHRPYESPLVDDAPWVDESDPATTGFYGVYATSITGDASSTRTATVTENILDGGVTGQVRHTSRQILVNAILVARDDLSMNSGLTWLKAALNADGCSTHGSSCGATDMCYFVAPPAVSDCRYDSFNTVQSTIDLGVMSVNQSPLIYTFPGNPEDMGNNPPRTAKWVVPIVDGAIIRYGALDTTDSEEQQGTNPIYLRRTNFIKNPSFHTSASNWSITGGSTLARNSSDTVYGRVTETAPVTVRTNWVADPAFTGSPATAGWRTNGTLTSVTDGTAQTGHRLNAALLSPETTVYAETNLLGPGEVQNSTVSFYIGQTTDAVTVTISDNSGAQVFSTVLTGLSSAWQRKNFSTTIGEDYVIRFTSAGTTPIKLSGMLVEAGASLGTYFDGSFADVPVSNIDYSFLDGTVLSASRVTTGVTTSAVLTSDATDSPYGPITASFNLRSATGASLLVGLVAPDGTTYSSRTIVPSSGWTRYQLGADSGRSAKLVITGAGSYDIDDVMIETGSIAGDYFDGDTTPAYGYEIEWLAGANVSASQMTYVGDMDTTKGDSEWRPFFSVIQGTIPKVQLQLTTSPFIPIEDQSDPFERHFHDVTCIEGPVIEQVYSPHSGSMISVSFILAAGVPFSYANSRPIDTTSAVVTQWQDPGTADNLKNYVTNPNLETASTGWTANSGTGPATATFTRVTGTAHAITGVDNPGTAFARATWSGGTATGVGGIQYSQSSSTKNKIMTASMYVRSSKIQRMQLKVTFGGATTILGPETVVAANTWARLVAGPYTVPHSATTFTIAAQNVAGTSFSQWTTGNTLDADCAMVMEGLNFQPFFDGGTTDDSNFNYAWSGSANASTSTRTVVKQVVIDPLQDPDCDPLPAPPRPPIITDACIDEVLAWNRHWVPIEQKEVAAWAASLPTIKITTKTDEIRQARVRFFPNPFGFPTTAIDPDSFCSEFIISYLPPRTTLTVDGLVNRAYAAVAGAPDVPASQLLYGTGGVPMSWPELSCGTPYVMTIDVPPGDEDNISVDLALTRRE